MKWADRSDEINKNWSLRLSSGFPLTNHFLAWKYTLQCVYCPYTPRTKRQRHNDAADTETHTFRERGTAGVSGGVPGWSSRRLRDAAAVSPGAGRGEESVFVCVWVCTLGGHYIMVEGGGHVLGRQTNTPHSIFILSLFVWGTNVKIIF